MPAHCAEWVQNCCSGRGSALTDFHAERFLLRILIKCFLLRKILVRRSPGWESTPWLLISLSKSQSYWGGSKYLTGGELWTIVTDTFEKAKRFLRPFTSRIQLRPNVFFGHLIQCNVEFFFFCERILTISVVRLFVAEKPKVNTPFSTAKFSAI